MLTKFVDLRMLKERVTPTVCPFFFRASLIALTIKGGVRPTVVGTEHIVQTLSNSVKKAMASLLPAHQQHAETGQDADDSG